MIPDHLALTNKLLLNLVRMELEGLRQSPIAVGEVLQKEQMPEEKERSLKTIKETFLLKWLPKELNHEERQEIEEIVEVRHLEKGDVCIRQNDPLHCFYFLLDGQLNVSEWEMAKHQSILCDVLKPGDSFGEICLIAPMLSPYAIEAFHPSTILIVDRKKLEQFSAKSAVQKLLLHLAQYHPDPTRLIKKNYGEITFLIPKDEKSFSPDQFDRLDFLSRHWLTEGFNQEEICQLDRVLLYQEYEKGEKIIQRGIPNRDLYFLLEGQVVLLEKPEGMRNEIAVEKLQPRDVFGEVGFVKGHEPQMTVVAGKDTKVLQLPFDKLKEPLDAKEKMIVKLFTSSARLMEKRLDRGKSKEESELHLKLQSLLRQKLVWILCLLALILSYLSHFKEWSIGWDLGITLLQIILPVGFIYGNLKDSLKNWGWAPQYLGLSLLQAVLCIGLMGGLFEILAQLADMPTFHFFSSSPWRMVSSLSLPVLGSYLLFVIIQEWLRRGIVVTAIQRGLEDGKGWWSALISAFLFLGYSAFYPPLFCMALFAKDLGLSLMFVRAPHLLGVILIHFVLGLFFASLGWFILGGQ